MSGVAGDAMTGELLSRDGIRGQAAVPLESLRDKLGASDSEGGLGAKTQHKKERNARARVCQLNIRRSLEITVSPSPAKQK